MTVSVLEQGRALLGALLLGGGIGVLYDLLRCLRYRIASPIFCGVLDLLFWLSATAVLFLWSVAAGDGVVQVSVCAALFLGAAVYLRFVSRLCFPVISWILNFLGHILGILLTPARLVWKLGVRAEKFFAFFCKKHFSFSDK